MGVSIGINNQAMTVKDMCIGINGQAKKVIKGFVGVGDLAKQFWPSGEAVRVIYNNGVWGWVPDGTDMSNYSTDFTRDLYTNKCMWWNGNAQTSYNGYVWEEQTIGGNNVITKSGVHNDVSEMSFWYIPLRNFIYGDFKVRIEAKWRQKTTYKPYSRDIYNYLGYGAYWAQEDWSATNELIGDELPAANQNFETFICEIYGSDEAFSYIVLDAYNGAPQIKKIEIIGGRDYWKKATHQPSAELTNNIVQPLYLDMVLTTTIKVLSPDSSYTETDVHEVDSYSSVVYRVVLWQWDYYQTYKSYHVFYVSENPFTLYQKHYKNDVYQYDATRTALAKTRHSKTYYYYGVGNSTNLRLVSTNADIGKASECLTYFPSTDISVWEAAYIAFDGTIL